MSEHFGLGFALRATGALGVDHNEGGRWAHLDGAAPSFGIGVTYR